MNRQKLQRNRWVVIFTGLCAVAGCGPSGPVLEDITGTVTFAGKPLPYGQIEFVPDLEAGHSGPAGSAEIVDGKFDTARGGHGVVPGSHLVRITGYEERPKGTGDDETAASDAKPPLFVGYTIEASVGVGGRTFDVPESAKGFNLYEMKAEKRTGNEP